MSHSLIQPRSSSLLLLRSYQPSDYEKLCSWCEAHERRPPPEATLPPLGVCVYRTADGVTHEEMLFLFLYLAQGCPICFLEHLTSRPGMTSTQTWRATAAACNHFKSLAASMGYRVMVCHTLRAIARLMIHEGWKKSEPNPPLTTMFIGLEPPAV